ncbi:outer membrane beta-barrel protein [sulfur-oxidizing endosymbiont of Gigantopelta aegis]|uniref:outer membrane beta-barrel protein n=1 Tax=sulfur-oxidizing endosymbiont of Gigantopelta aegis TaxID=2794934 RepID=UPI0018DD3FE3|nr:outer membrane beta-barrel protein [sulfur-oxidizing endosymbiont of Gigantopelta aegis]
MNQAVQSGKSMTLLVKRVQPNLISLAILASLVTSATVWAGEKTLDYPLGFGLSASPAMGISTKYDDNIFLQDKVGVKSSWITELAPSITLGAQKGLDYYTAKYTLKAGRYHSSRNDDYVDHLLQLDTHNEFNYRNKLDLSFDFLKLHEKRGSGISDGPFGVSKTPYQYKDAITNATYTYGGDESQGQIKVNASHFYRKYINYRNRTRGFDRSEDLIGPTFYYRVMPKTSLLFEATYKDIDYKNDISGISTLDGDETTFQVGVTWETTAKTTGTAQIGRTYKDFDSSQRKDNDFTSWRMGVEWSPLTYSVFTLVSASEAKETNGTGNFIRDKSVGLSWQHAWSDKLDSNVGISFLNEDYIDSIRDDDLENYQAGVNYQFRRALGFGIKYTYKTRDSNIRTLDYTDNIIMFTAKIGM